MNINNLGKKSASSFLKKRSANSRGFAKNKSNIKSLPELEPEVMNNSDFRKSYLTMLSKKFDPENESLKLGIEDKIIKILRIPPNARGVQHIEQLVEAFKSTDYFITLKNEGKDDIISDCVRELRLETFK